MQKAFLKAVGSIVNTFGEQMPHEGRLVGTSQRRQEEQQQLTEEDTDAEWNTDEEALDEGRIVQQRKRRRKLRAGKDSANLVLIPLALFSSKKEIYKFLTTNSPDFPEVTYEYFTEMWHRFFPNVQLKKWNPFAKCSTCVKLRNQYLVAKDDAARTVAKVAQAEHREAIQCFRQRHLDRTWLASQFPADFLDILADGMDSNKTRPPRCRSDAVFSKEVEMAGESYDSRLMGMYLEGRGFLGYWEHPTYKRGASNLCSLLTHALQRVLDREGELPPVLFLHLDNTTKDNKNNVVIKYLGSLVNIGTFLEVWIMFLPVGHTHVRIDQIFSVINRLISGKDCFDLEQLIEEVSALDFKLTEEDLLEHHQVRQALDYDSLWARANDRAWHLKGLLTARLDDVKHCVHLMRIRRQVGSRADGITVCQRKWCIRCNTFLLPCRPQRTMMTSCALQQRLQQMEEEEQQQQQMGKQKEQQQQIEQREGRQQQQQKEEEQQQ